MNTQGIKGARGRAGLEPVQQVLTVLWKVLWKVGQQQASVQCTPQISRFWWPGSSQKPQWREKKILNIYLYLYLSALLAGSMLQRFSQQQKGENGCWEIVWSPSNQWKSQTLWLTGLLWTALSSPNSLYCGMTSYGLTELLQYPCSISTHTIMALTTTTLLGNYPSFAHRAVYKMNPFWWLRVPCYFQLAFEKRCKTRVKTQRGEGNTHQLYLEDPDVVWLMLHQEIRALGDCRAPGTWKDDGNWVKRNQWWG